MNVATAYDAVAAGYDDQVAEDAWMRRLLWRRYLALFRPGDRVIDVGCGTGLDTLFLAGRGLRMTGLDISPGMLAELAAKAERAGLSGRIERRLGDVAALAGWPPASFDGLLSAFAGLNSANLEVFAAEARRLLRPGGRALLHLLAPAGIWTRHFADLQKRRERRVTIAGQEVRLQLLPARELYDRHFAAGFRLRRAYGLGFLWPQAWGRRLPAGLARRLGALEEVLGRFEPFRGWGRFCVLELEREDPGG